jgi:hypothetical protein
MNLRGRRSARDITQISVFLKALPIRLFLRS